jgi:hypothetical protein
LRDAVVLRQLGWRLKSGPTVQLARIIVRSAMAMMRWQDGASARVAWLSHRLRGCGCGCRGMPGATAFRDDAWPRS